MKKKNFIYYMPTKVIFDDNAVEDLPKYVKGKSLLVMCDPYLFSEE